MARDAAPEGARIRVAQRVTPDHRAERALPQQHVGKMRGVEAGRRRAGRSEGRGHGGASRPSKESKRAEER
eukprot:4778546-Prymnesium_polylepis.1